MSFAGLSLGPFVICLLFISIFNLIENILIEYILTKRTKEKNKEDQGQVVNNELPYFFGFESLGKIFGFFFGGRVIESFGNTFSFKVALIAPSLLLPSLFLYDEQYVDPENKKEKSISDDLLLLKNLLVK